VSEPEKTLDPRLTGELIHAIDGQPVGPGIWAVAMSPLVLADGTRFAFHSPQPVAFNLVEAHRHIARGVLERDEILSSGIVPREGDGRHGAKDTSALLDCVGDLASGVLFAFTAIESFANHSIDQLDEAASLTLTRRDKTKRVVERNDMVRDLGTVEKLDRVVPLLTGRPSVKGSKEWHRFVELKRLRDGLVHVKDRGYSANPDEPSVYGQLILGMGDGCAMDAALLIRAMRPEFLPPHLLEELGLPTSPCPDASPELPITKSNRATRRARRSAKSGKPTRHRPSF
jgi:hypothetical protein